MDFLKKKRDFVDLIIKHIGTSAIMDLLLRLLTCIEPPQPRQDVLNVSKITTVLDHRGGERRMGLWAAVCWGEFQGIVRERWSGELESRGRGIKNMILRWEETQVLQD